MPRASAIALALAGLLAPRALLAGAPPRVEIPEGTWVRLFDLSPDDAWYAHRERLGGLSCVVGPGPMRPQEATWFDGKVHCQDGLDYVFYQSTFEVLSAVAPTVEGCPTGSWTGGIVPDGSRVRILDVSAFDAYAASSGEVVGQSGMVLGDLYPQRGPQSCWLGGGIYGDTGVDWYFYEVAVAVETLGEGLGIPMTPPSTAEPICPPDAFTGDGLAHGTRVQLLAIHPDDAYWDVRSEHEGRVGAVEGDLHNNSDTCWFGGGFTSDTGIYSYFYKAAVRVIGEADPYAMPECAEGVATAPTVPKDHRVKIVDIHPDDAYFSTRFSVVGKTGTVREPLEQTGECWYAGAVAGDGGEDWYFYRASVVDLGTPQ